MEIQHFSHEHPLILSEELNDSGRYSCFGCWKPISAPFYSCRQCMRFLHKSCADLPRESQHHPMHPNHPLTLHKMPPNPYLDCRCDVCGNYWEGFTYNCELCNFDLDVNCASLPLEIDFGGHEHRLALWPRRASFSCDACRTTHLEAGFSYHCNTCLLWVHEMCASLPDCFVFGSHEHPLSLTYSLLLDYSMHRYSCRNCNDELAKKCWVYYCADCKYIVDLKCAVPAGKAPPSLKPSLRNDNIANDQLSLIRLPVPDITVNFMSLIFKRISLGENKKPSVDDRLKHFSHDHPLTLFGELKMDENHEICDGCARPVLAPFYSCAQCKFFLHKWCAELPHVVHQPLHQDHPFTLVAKAPKFQGLFKCSICFKFSNGFAFHDRADGCNMFIDIKCATYPATIKHEGHEHILKLGISMEEPCSGCSRPFFGLAFECTDCHFKLDPQCASLPRVVRHRYDKKHPLLLTYPSAVNPIEEFYCEICEEEIFSNFWFYHCAECDLSIQPKCICKVEDVYANVKFGGTLHLTAHHPHPLTLAKKTEVKPPCDRCGEYFEGPAFVCRQCNYHLHSDCASAYSSQEFVN